MKSALTILAILAFTLAHAQEKKGFSFIDRKDKQEVDVMYNDTLLTAYCYYESVMKPILFPLKTLSGITVTRGFPIDPRPGERTDHPHQVGMWFSYQDVNGVRFWGNSPAVPYSERSSYGVIRHDRVAREEANSDKATLEVSAQWRKNDNTVLLAEVTRYDFQVDGSNFIIDRITTLIALRDSLVFHDAIDGLMGIRVASQLELPGAKVKGAAKGYVDPGNPAATGDYMSSEGVQGEAVWGQRAKWMMLAGQKDDQQVSIIVIDNPQNIGYPAYWHARGYGLLAINPLGQGAFAEGAKKMNYTMRMGDQATFRYRVIIHDGTPMPKAQIDHYADEFKGVQ